MEETQEQKKGGFNPFFIVGALVVVVVLGGLVMVMSKSASKQPAQAKEQMNMSPTSTTQSETSTKSVEGASTAAQTDSNEKVINVEAGSFYYKPNMITVKKGQKVKIVMHSVSMMHNFNIDELNVHGPLIKNGDTATIEFTADKVGTFEYYCSVGQHRQLGQVGKLTVTE